ncbi:MAG: diguanylate cyclase [Spongiibacteraceae bacterium]
MTAGIFIGLAMIATVVFLLRNNWRSRRMAVSVAEIAQPEESANMNDDNLFSQAPVALCQLALDGRIVRANQQLQTLCGFDEERLGAYFLPNLLHSDDIGMVNVVMGQLSAGNANSLELRSRLLHADGYSVWVHLAIRLVRSRGNAVHFIATMTEIGQYMLAEQIAQSEHVKFAAIAAQVPVAVWLLSPDYQIIFANDALETLTGYSKESFFADSRRYFNLIHPEDAERVREAMQVHGIERNYEINYRIIRDDGEIRCIRQLGRGVYDSHGKLLYSVASAMDISSEMAARDELHELNSRLREANLRLCESVRLDGLTRCLNRVALFDEAEKALMLARRYQRISTIIFFDLNDFKDINDNFGHHVGDRALVAFAEQIKARLRTTDELGRYGGDEFVVLLRETDADQAVQLISTLPPIIVDNEDGSSIIVRYSAGIACSDDEAIESVDDWLRIADGLMYRQKGRQYRESSARG